MLVNDGFRRALVGRRHLARPSYHAAGRGPRGRNDGLRARHRRRGARLGRLRRARAGRVDGVHQSRRHDATRRATRFWVRASSCGATPNSRSDRERRRRSAATMAATSSGDSGWFPGGGVFVSYTRFARRQGRVRARGNFGGTLNYDNDWVGRYYVQQTWIVGLSFLPVDRMEGQRQAVAGRVAQRDVWHLQDQRRDQQRRSAARRRPAQGEGRDVGLGRATWGCSTNSRPRRALGLHLELAGRPRLQRAARVRRTGAGRQRRAGARPACWIRASTVGIKVPQQAMASMFTQVDDRWALLGSVGWQQWSKFGQVQIGIDDSLNPDQPDHEPFRSRTRGTSRPGRSIA